MKRVNKLFITLIIFAGCLALVGIGLCSWILGLGNDSSGGFESYNVFNLNDYIDLTSNQSYYSSAGKNVNCLKYYDTGFLNIDSSDIQSNGIIRCYYSLIPSQVGVSDSSFSLVFSLAENDTLNLLDSTTITSTIVQQISLTNTSTKSTGDDVITYSNISSSYNIRLYFYVEFVISELSFDTFLSNVDNIDLSIDIEIVGNVSSKWKLGYNSDSMTPQYDALTYISNKLDGESKNYSGTAVNVFTDDNSNNLSFLGSRFNSNNFDLYYYDIDNEIYSSKLPSKAGTYTFKITYHGETNDFETFSFTINGTKIYAISKNSDLAIIELNYDSDCRAWGADFCTAIKKQLSFVTESGLSVLTSSSDYDIAYIYDGTFKYEYNSNTSTYSLSVRPSQVKSDYINVAGSTYYVSLKINDESCTLENTIVLKYKTASCNSTYYTIEDAFPLSEKTTLVGNASDTDYIITAFSKWAINNSFYSSSKYSLNKTLYVPHTNLGESAIDKVYATAPTTYLPCACLFVPNNSILNIQSSGKIYVTAQISGRGMTGDHGVIMNNGIINFNSGSYLYSYGYSKGNGKLYFKSGSTIMDEMWINDWSRALDGNSVYSSGAFPFCAWGINNISCEMLIYKGAVYMAHSTIYGSNLLVGYKEVDATIIGASYESSGCLFVPKSNAVSTDYIRKSSSYFIDSDYDANSKITSSNQDNHQKSIIELHGNYKDQTFSVHLYLDMSTSPSMSLPIGFMDFLIGKNSTVDLSNSSYLFLRGTTLTVEAGATVNISGGIYVALDKSNGTESTICPFFDSYCQNKVNATLINNGNINIVGGYAGGIISTNEVDSLINGAKNKISEDTIKYKSSNSAASSYSSDYALYGNTESVNNAKLTSVAYESMYSTKYYWSPIASVYSYTINFYDGSTLVHSTDISSVNSTYTFTGSEYVYSKDYYDFDDWYTSSALTSVASRTIINSGEPLNVYAKFTPTQYRFTYTMILNDSTIISSSDSNLSGYNNLPITFTYESTWPISIPSLTYVVESDTCLFDGWYIVIDVLGNTYSRSIGNSLTKSQFESLVSTANNYGIDISEYAIPIVCNFYNYDPLEITFESNYGSYTMPSNYSNIGNFTYTLPSISDYDETNYEESKYPSGWKNTVNGITLGYNETITVNIVSGTYYINGTAISGNSITLTVSWTSKYKLLFNYQRSGVANVIRYFTSGQTVAYPSVPTVSGVVFNDWYTDLSLTDVFSGIMPSEDSEIFAKWLTSYTLTFYIDSSTSQTASYAEGQLVSLIEPEKSGYVFYAWYEESTFNNKITSPYYMPREDTTIYAKFNYKPIVSVSVSADKTAITGAGTYKLTATCTPSDVIIQSVNWSLTVNSGSAFTASSSNDTSLTWSVTSSNAAGNATVTVTVTDMNGYTASDTITLVNTKSGCFTTGTLITLGDGTQKPIEELLPTDLIMSFNHYTGEFVATPIIGLINHGKINTQKITLLFSDDSSIELLEHHDLYDRTLNKYVTIRPDNCQEFIGDIFAIYNKDSIIYVELVNVYVEEVYEEAWSLIAYKYINTIANNFLTITPAINMFYILDEFNENMMYDDVLISEYEELYGTYTYDMWKDYIPFVIYEGFNFDHVPFAIGKGKSTEQDIFNYIAWINELMNSGELQN